MDIDELRRQVSTVQAVTDSRWRALVGVFLTAALLCSLATAFAPWPEWPAAGAVLFLALGLFWARAIERGNFEVPPVRKP